MDIKNKFKLGSLVLLVILNIFIWSSTISSGGKDNLKVVFLDVGQGDAIFIEAPNGNQVLIDGGGDDTVLRELSKVMPFYDRTIDMVIATHPDKDHIGGLSSVLNRFDVEVFLESGSRSDTLTYGSLEESLKNSTLHRIVVKRGMSFNLGQGALLEVLFPDRDVSGVDPNTASIITKLSFGETSFMLTGDSPKSIERYLTLIYGKNLKSDVLKAGHHGSKTSSGEVFMGFVSPKIAVISAGEENRYGHPHKEILDRLEHFGVSILSTASSGSLVFYSNGNEVWVK